MSTNGNVSLGPFKFNVKGMSAAGIVILSLFFIALAIALIVIAFWLLVANFMLIASGEFNWVNALWFFIAAYWLISSATTHTDS